MTHFVSQPGPKPRLLIFTSYPEPGRVKTRLIAALGAQGAADLHQEMTAWTLASVDGLENQSWEVEVRFAGGSVQAMIDRFGPSRRYAPQGQGDLGDRLNRACAT